MAVAVLTAVWAVRVTTSPRATIRRLQERVRHAESRSDSYEALLDNFAGVVLVWDGGHDNVAEGWGKPRLYGSQSAIATLLRYIDATDGPDVAARLLNGLADFEARDAGAASAETTLRRCLSSLQETGKPFSLTITAPHGRFIEADGRPSGARALLWLTDATMRIAEQSSARGKIEEDRRTIARDPEAFLDMLAKSPFPVWRLSSGLKLEWANPEYLEAVGAEGLIEAVDRDLMFDAEVKEQARRALADGGRTDDIRAVVVDGERRHYSIFVFPVSGGATAFAIDITKAVVAHEALERYARSQEQALNRLDEAVVIFTSDQKLSFYNDAFAEQFRLERKWLERAPTHGELLDHLRERKMIPGDKNYADWRARELSRYGALDDALPEDVWRLPDARVLRVSRVGHPEGGILMVFGDITEKVELEIKYNTLIRVLQATLDKLSEGVLVFRQDGSLRLWNQAFADLWNLDAAALKEGLPFDDLVSLCMPVFSDRTEWADMKARCTDPTGRRVHSGEWRPSGRILTYITQPLPDGDTVIAFSDVTASRLVAEALADRNEALKQADKIKSDFVDHVSYQLRGPMQTIIGYSELLKRELGEELPEKQIGWLSNVMTAADDLNKLVEDILSVAAIEAGEFGLTISDVEMDAAMESATKLALAKRMDHRVRLIVECEPDVGTIRADAKCIRGVIYNLTLNAIDASAAGDAVTVGAVREGAVVHLYVEDQGVGIAPADRAKIFETWKNARPGGAGLGLALVRDFVELHGGWVDLESEQGKGTRVTCHLPDSPPAETEDRDDTAARDVSPRRLADDSSDDE